MLCMAAMVEVVQLSLGRGHPSSARNHSYLYRGFLLYYKTIGWLVCRPARNSFQWLSYVLSLWKGKVEKFPRQFPGIRPCHKVEDASSKHTQISVGALVSSLCHYDHLSNYTNKVVNLINVRSRLHTCPTRASLVNNTRVITPASYLNTISYGYISAVRVGKLDSSSI